MTPMESKKNEAYRGIRRAIIAGELRPGDVVNEAELATQYHVSKTPVREALALLTFENLIKPLARFGYMVTPITLRDVQEAFHLRALLETEAVGLAARRITPAEIEALERTIAVGSQTSDLGRNREFHLLIAQASGNQRLAALIERLLDEMDRMLALDPQIFAPPAPGDHSETVAALKKGDARAAREAIQKHIEGSRDRVMARFQEHR